MKIDGQFDGLREIADLIEEDESKPSIEINERVEDVKRVYESMRELTKGENVKVTYKVHEPYQSTGSVTVIGKSIKFDNPKAVFELLSEKADNFEVYPKTDGTIQLNAGFNGLTKKVRR